MFTCKFSPSQVETQNAGAQRCLNQRQGPRKAGYTGPKIRQRLSLRQAALKGKKNKVGTAAHAEFTEQVRNVKLHRALRNVALAGNLFVRKIFEQPIENYLLAATQIRDRIVLQTTSQSDYD